jgi:hypothetical protein
MKPVRLKGDGIVDLGACARVVVEVAAGLVEELP